MTMKLLKIYDATEVFENTKDDKNLKYLKVFIQEDVWDFHVFRLLNGDYEGNEDVYTVECVDVPKIEVLERMGLYETGMGVRDVFSYLYDYNVIMTILDIDKDNGYENLDFHTYESAEQAIENITDKGFYEIKALEFIEELPEEKGLMKTIESLRESEMLLKKILNDARFIGFDNVVVDTYQNGREHGYRLRFENQSGNEMAITFSQTRGGEGIVIYYGLDSAVGIDKEVRTTSFGYREFKEARDFIFEILKNDANISADSAARIQISDSLEVSRGIWERLRKDENISLFAGGIECLQSGSLSGYALYPYDSKKSQSVLITFAAKNEGQIVVHSGRYVFRGLPEASSETAFKVDEVDEVIKFILKELEEKCDIRKLA